MNISKSLQDQIAYYGARADEYDEWFFRKGRYDRGPEANQRWLNAVDIVRGALDSFAPTGTVLELACGTGIWTSQLAKHAETVLAVDAALEMLERNRSKVNATHVEYLQADIFDWVPDRQFDVIFFGFWLSHVPQILFEEFWKIVRAALNPGGRVFLIDSLFNPESQPRDRTVPDEASGRQLRCLNDGRSYTVFKQFYPPNVLTEKLDLLGWDATFSDAGGFFVYGSAMPKQTE